jgi:hypothetical protein
VLGDPVAELATLRNPVADRWQQPAASGSACLSDPGGHQNQRVLASPRPQPQEPGAPAAEARPDPAECPAGLGVSSDSTLCRYPMP